MAKPSVKLCDNIILMSNIKIVNYLHLYKLKIDKSSSLNLSTLMHKFLMTNKRILLSLSKILLSICYKLHV